MLLLFSNVMLLFMIWTLWLQTYNGQSKKIIQKFEFKNNLANSQEYKKTPLYKSRNKRYALYGTKWPNENITYSVENYPRKTNFTNENIDIIIQQAFDTWANQTNLKFEKKNFGAQVDIKISFEDRLHRKFHLLDLHFDGPGGIYAHAWRPTIGDVHFDNDENWGNAPQEISLLRTAAHEFGHALGLGHSNVPGALMLIDDDYLNTAELSQDDIDAIQKLYGTRLDLCNNASIDAAFVTANETIILMKRDWYWEFTSQQEMLDGYPKLISDYWQQPPMDIDAAFTFQNNTYFLKTKYIWRFSNNILDLRYPSRTSFKEVWNAGAMYSEGNEIIIIKDGIKYILSNQHPYRFYQGSFSNLTGISSNDSLRVSAACILQNNKVFIFSGENYYLLNSSDNQVIQAVGEPPYPRSIAEYWFGCPNDVV